MKQTAEVQDTRFDALKWAAAVVLVAVAVAGNVYFADQPMIYRVIGVVVLVVAALGIALTTSRGRELTSLARNAKKEIQRVVWPTRQETFQTTAIVLGAVVIVGLLLWLIDMFFGWLVSTLIG
ncbi:MULTISPECIES: preprotein translocase subunit SecE [Kushneria]|uniref:Protein translocase subunit SecE n=2 Tax=Kushneria TaxID=504090 RepID=A0A240UQ24_9GAMM|nr:MULTISPECIES: preprotein translocase subunit SecE [Kushneria]ARS52104.1 preprotein translocase subunit SecE [Kushneria konosiri]ART63591.1 preprotein translocase subunit SecE [Kushneria marisflavi]RKD85254.1 protein translocase subunit secE/sec61 gamma [Kushneria marisflavi]